MSCIGENSTAVCVAAANVVAAALLMLHIATAQLLSKIANLDVQAVLCTCLYWHSLLRPPDSLPLLARL
jgi:hypothetical protein